MRLSIKGKLFASYLFVAVLCTVLLVSFSLTVFILNFENYSHVVELTPVERLIFTLFEEGKVPDFRYIPRDMEEQFFTDDSTREIRSSGIRGWSRNRQHA